MPIDPTPNVYDVGEPVSLYARFLTGATIGSIRLNQTLLQVRDPELLDLNVGATLVVVGGGAVGGDFVTTVVSVDGQDVTVADQAPTTSNLAVVGNPTPPDTVTCKVELPDGTESTVAATSIATGRYRAIYTPALDGDHYYRFTGTGAAEADGWRKFVVRPERVP